MARVEQFSNKVQFATSTSSAKLGTPFYSPDGAVYRYALNGASNIAAGRLVQSVVPTSAHVNVAVQAAAAAGLFKFTVTLGATAVVANEYADGYVYINDAGADTTTEGYRYRIKSHPAAAASATLELTLYEDSPLIIALTTNSEATLHHSPTYAVIIHPSPPTAELIGVTPCAVLANYYFWCQTKGPAAVLTEGTLVAGDYCVASLTADGAAAPAGAGEAEAATWVGKVMSVNATTEESLIRLMLE